jgi:hypothetical protein
MHSRRRLLIRSWNSTTVKRSIIDFVTKTIKTGNVEMHRDSSGKVGQIPVGNPRKTEVVVEKGEKAENDDKT